jgi:hypothetical protein
VCESPIRVLYGGHICLLSFRNRRARLVGEFHHPQMQLIEDSKSVGQE